jgi:hypothetical protein
VHIETLSPATTSGFLHLLNEFLTLTHTIRDIWQLKSDSGHSNAWDKAEYSLDRRLNPASLDTFERLPYHGMGEG